MRLLPAPAAPVSAPSPTILGALKNIGAGLYHATAKFAGYKAALPTATTGVGSRIGTNPNSTWAQWQRVGMSFTAEMLSKDNPLVSAYLASRQNYCSSQMTYIPATPDTGLNKAITEYLHGYDGTGGKFSTMGVDCSMQDAFMRTADIETPVRGDAGLIIHRQDEDLRLIEFSADQLGEIYMNTMPRACSLTRASDGFLKETSGNDTIYCAGRYFQGCDCIAYKIYQRTNAWYGMPQIYPASDVIFFRDPASYRGVRGVTFFAQAAMHLQKSEDLLQAALSAAQRQARTFGRVFNNSGQSDDPSYETNSCGQVTFFEKVPDGPISEYFFNGDSADFTAPNTPSAEVISGIETADERVAIALRLNYAFLISATKVGGAPSRLEVEKADKEFQRIQNTIHRPRIRRIVDIVLMDAMRRGDLIPPRGMTASQFKQGRSQLPISPSVDAFYDATENIKMMRAGLESAEDIIAETNRNADDVIAKSKSWAIKCAMAVEDANKDLVAAGYKPSITIADIAQVSDNPQQAAAAEAVSQGKPAAGGNETDTKKQVTASLKEWDESKHPRGHEGNAGEFGPGGGGGTATIEKPKSKPVASSFSEGAHIHKSRESGDIEMRDASAAERKALAIPPAYGVAKVPVEKDSPLLWKAQAPNGKIQLRRSETQAGKQLQAKHERGGMFSAELPEIKAKWEKDMATNDAAKVLRLVHQTGFRNGGEGGGGKTAAYGASSLRSEHVTVAGDKIHFMFPGKGGHIQDHELVDPILAKHFAERKASGAEKMFDTNDSKVREYLHSIDGDFIVHDFRTHAATRTAAAEVDRLMKANPPANKKEAAAIQRAALVLAARKIGDTVSVAKSTYVNPQVFEKLNFTK